jgi:hypothetical protein
MSTKKKDEELDVYDEAVYRTREEHMGDLSDQMSKVRNQILNRKPFEYNVNEDALYNQYKDKYIAQGKLASADAMGQASALTGGYGNSYAATVGNQAYQASMQDLNNIIPELYSLALERDTNEKNDLYNKHSMLSDEYASYADVIAAEEKSNEGVKDPVITQSTIDRLKSGFSLPAYESHDSYYDDVEDLLQQKIDAGESKSRILYTLADAMGQSWIDEDEFDDLLEWVEEQFEED